MIDFTDPQLNADFALVFTHFGALLFTVGGFVLMFGAKRLFAQFIVLGFISILIANFGPAALHGIPVLVLLGLGVLIGFSILGHVLALFIGRGAADSAIGNLLAYVLRVFFLPFVLPFRLFRLLMRRDDP